MANIILNPGNAGNLAQYKRYTDMANAIAMTLDFSAVTAVTGTKSTGSDVTGTVTAAINQLRLEAPVSDGYELSGATFKRGGLQTTLKSTNTLEVLISQTTGVGTVIGALSGGVMQLNSWTSGSAPDVTEWRAVAAPPVNGSFTPFGDYEVMFRTAAAPLRSGSFSVLGTLSDGTTFNVTADSAGHINTARVKGLVNYSTGVVDLFFVKSTPTGSQTTISLAFLGIAGVGDVYLDRVRTETLRYNAVAFAYLPLDATILGIDPVRLPSDGRVPIFRPGGIVVVGDTQSTTPQTVTTSTVINTGRVRLSRVRVVGNNGDTINTGYTADLEAGTVSFTNVTGYSQPVHVEHRIEDMVQLRDAQINGDLTFNPALSHAYPVGARISSALIGADLTARTSLLFDQGSWDGVTYSDTLIGSAATATYNDTAAPIVVTNIGTETERWVIHFTSTSAFRVIGEHVGVVATGSINTDCSPVNPVTSQPYFTILALGWGTGWSVGNIVRLNTVGARFPVWAIRTVKQGAATGEDYSFTLLTRGDVDNPI